MLNFEENYYQTHACEQNTIGNPHMEPEHKVLNGRGVPLGKVGLQQTHNIIHGHCRGHLTSFVRMSVCPMLLCYPLQSQAKAALLLITQASPGSSRDVSPNSLLCTLLHWLVRCLIKPVWRKIENWELRRQVDNIVSNVFFIILFSMIETKYNIKTFS